MKTHSPLARAIAFLSAVEISPGRYAYRDMHRYYIATGSQLARLGRYLEAQIRQRTMPAIALPQGGGYSEWGADTVTFEMPAWWTPAISLEALAMDPARDDRAAERETAEKLIRWVKKRRAFEPTTAIVARLKLRRDFDHCMMIDDIRYGSEKSARAAALTLASEIIDVSLLDRADEYQPPSRRHRSRS